MSISYNSTARARWYDTLGDQRDRFFPKCLKSLRPFGGPVPMIQVFVAKKYPLSLSSYNG